jgi:uncharacterized protein YjbI with pentapeptide repeats
MKLITTLLASSLIVVTAAQAETNLNPSELPKFVRQWLSGHNFSDKPKVTGTFHQSRLNGSNFQGAKFSNANFEMCDLADSNMQGAVFGSGTKFFRCTLNGADLRGANFEGAVVNSVNFRGADLRKAKNLKSVTKANFQRADLRGADLSKMAMPMVQIDWDDAIYDKSTKFPVGFDPAKAGAFLKAN